MIHPVEEKQKKTVYCLPMQIVDCDSLVVHEYKKHAIYVPRSQSALSVLIVLSLHGYYVIVLLVLWSIDTYNKLDYALQYNGQSIVKAKVIGRPNFHHPITRPNSRSETQV